MSRTRGLVVPGMEGTGMHGWDDWFSGMGRLVPGMEGIGTQGWGDMPWEGGDWYVGIGGTGTMDGETGTQGWK